MKTIVYSLFAFSEVHCGIGQGLSDIDLPTARHAVSGHPVIPGSSLKGVLKCEYDQSNPEAVALFGSSADGEDGVSLDTKKTTASAISVNDSLLVALPVRSYYGTFAYLASPYTLENLKRQICNSDSSLKEKFASLEIPLFQNTPKIKSSATSVYRSGVTETSCLLEPVQNSNPSLLLEELDLVVDQSLTEKTTQIAAILAEIFFKDEGEKQSFMQRFAIVDDNILNFFCETALPVSPHITIDKNTGTVADGSLWYEEYIPSMSLFCGTISVDNSFAGGKETDEDLCRYLTTAKKTLNIQIGGRATIGKGFVSLTYHV